MSFGRLFFIVIGILLLVGTGTAWTLSTQGIVIQNSWSTALGTGFGVLGSLFGFCQWAISLPSSEPKTSTNPATLEAQESFVKQVYDRLSPGNGAIIIYEKMSRVGSNLDLDDKQNASGGWKDHSQANIVERMINSRSLVTAIFPDLEPGPYRVTRHGWPVGPYKQTEITVLAKQVTEIDWRGQGEEVRKRQSLFSGLRTGSLLVGIGGLLFLAHRYLTIPYLNPYLELAGGILIGAGVFWLIATLFDNL